MPESFVDLSYRGLSLGRRIKLTQIRPTTGYLEHPTPMPVGTEISISTDDGVVVVATVAAVHEQVGGSDRPPGMMVKPMLDDATGTWWQQRVAMPELAPDQPVKRPEPAPRQKSVTVRPRTHTVPQPAPHAFDTSEGSTPLTASEPVVTSQPAVMDTQRTPIPNVDARSTLVMNRDQQEMLEQLSRDPSALDQLTRTTDEHPVVDDGLRTTLMDAVDPAALGLEPSASGSMASAGDDDEGGDDAPSADPEKPPEPEKRGFFKRRKKKR
ncbi:MAG TPA: hypothetical protein VFQ53_00305 [Kofleriaceae bacterium]|nr:hypothetical protein [Kofleriaceae bacterium]